MSGSQRLTATPAGVRLCQLEAVPVKGARSLVLQMRAGHFHGVVVRSSDAVAGYLDHCPHSGLPLARKADDYLVSDGSLIACSWHGALFRPADGLCVGGPCAGQSLTLWPVTVEDGWVVTA